MKFRLQFRVGGDAKPALPTVGKRPIRSRRGSVRANSPPDQRKEKGLASNVLALEVKQIHAGDKGWGSITGKGYRFISGRVRQGDLIIAVDGNTASMRESDLIAYMWQQKNPGDKVTLTILRDGQEQDVTLRLPML